MISILGVIPARYSSTRFPAKLLQRVIDKSILEMVYLRCLEAKCLSKVVVATDHKTIFDHVKGFGGNVVMTSEIHNSGTDRCFEATNIMGGNAAYEYIINIQGDEPLIEPKLIDSLGQGLGNGVNILTACSLIKDQKQLFSPNTVKIVKNKLNKALYFSRSPIPFLRDIDTELWLQTEKFYKHIGIYAFRTETLEKLVRLPSSKLELTEKLEQLRWLENGFDIYLTETKHEAIGIDTPEDLEALRQFLSQNKRI